MSELRSANSVEMEIHAFLGQFLSAEKAAEALLKKYEKLKLSSGEFEAIASFLSNAGLYSKLAEFALKKMFDESLVPWGHFAEALFQSSNSVDAKVKKALIEGASESRRIAQLCRTHVLDDFDPRIPELRKQRKDKFLEKALKKKTDLLVQLEVFKSQSLRAEEDQVIRQLQKMFPEDSEIHKLRISLRERLAQDYITKRPQKSRREIFFPLYEEKTAEEQNILEQIEISMKEAAKSAKYLANDFAIAHMVWENFDAALRLVEIAPNSPVKDWLKAEILLRSRRFAELLDQLIELEEKYSEEPETVFAVYYLRAQALWGLDQKKTAIEILEGMVETRPSYRAAGSLLKEWKEDLL